MATTAPATTAPASGLLKIFERADATLSLVESRVGNEVETATGSRHNPARLLRRLAALEAELPKLRAAAVENAAARRAILGPLFEQQVSNQQALQSLARRACADIDAEQAQWEGAHREAEAQLQLCNGNGAAAGDSNNDTDGGAAAPSNNTCAPSAPRAGLAQTTAAAPASSALPDPTANTVSAPQPVPAPSAGSSPITELEWLRLATAQRDGVGLDELNDFWRCLRSHFVRRETRELQAAQLLAVGVRIGEQKNARMLRLLERLGRLTAAQNAVRLAAA